MDKKVIIKSIAFILFFAVYYFVEHLVETNLLNDINIKNFNLISHYADIIHSDKDTEVVYY